MRTNFKKFYKTEKTLLQTLIRFFVFGLLIFSIMFFIWSVMRYNRIQAEKADREQYLLQLTEKIDELEYIADMPVDDAFKIRIARERLGMCFADEIIFYTDVE